MENWPTGNVSSNLVSETKIMSILSLIVSFRGSDKFLTEFVFIWPIKNYFFLIHAKLKMKYH